MISTPTAELEAYEHSTSQRIQEITSSELMCELFMKRVWFCMVLHKAHIVPHKASVV